MASLHVGNKHRTAFKGKGMAKIEDRLSPTGFSSEDENGEESDGHESYQSGSDNEDAYGQHENGLQKSGMANIISRILSKDTSNSNRLLLAKGKTEREIQEDVARRRKRREKEEGGEAADEDEGSDDEKHLTFEEQRFKIEKRKMWENMGRKASTEMDIRREVNLKRIATRGMVQLFQSVHDHQKLMNQKIASVGPSERKKDKVLAEFTKGKFLDVLKSKSDAEISLSNKTKDEDSGGGKWKILQDDFMMGAQMKDWDKEEDDDEEDDDNNVEMMSDDELSS